jgi:two-component system, chemotaxis family, chemotaxis protein CheY
VAGEENRMRMLQEREKRRENIIMIVDDDLFTISIFQKYLSSLGRILDVSDKTRVIETYQQYLPDIVFLDLHMPHNDGFAILSAIMDYDPSAVVVMLSADVAQANVLEATKRGARGYISKPFTRDTLIKYLNTSKTVSFSEKMIPIAVQAESQQSVSA